MKRLGRWSLVGVGLAGVVLAFSVAPGGATPPSGLTQVVLARGNDVSHGTIPLQFGTDIVMVQLTVDPGGSSGWHSHPGGAIIVVKQGSITVHKAIGSQCQIETYSAGQAFLERPAKSIRSPMTSTCPLHSSRHLPACAAGRLPEN